MRFKPIFAALCVALAGFLSAGSQAQDKPPVVEIPQNLDAQNIAKSFIEQLLRVSHASEIYADLRKTLAGVYIPFLRDLIQGGVPGAPAPDEKTATAMAKLLTFLDYVRKASDELDPVLGDYRDGMISDAATQISKNAKGVDIKDVRDLLELPAVKKGLDTFYTASKLVTGFSYKDSQTFTRFSAWLNGLKMDWNQGLPDAQGGGNGVPSNQKIAKAQAFISDLMRVSHLDENVADVRHFMRDVYPETAPVDEAKRQELRDEADQYEFSYNMQKAILLAAGPAVIAAALTDEQIATLHGFLRSPAFVNLFDRLRATVKTGTALTKTDVIQARKAVEDLDKKANVSGDTPERQEKAKAEWDALINKWTDKLKERLTADTRAGLEQSLQALKTETPPI